MATKPAGTGPGAASALLRRVPCLKEVVGIVKRNIRKPPCRIYLYGSWAKGNALPASDVDIAVDAGRPLPVDLWNGIRGEVDALKTLRTVELVDLRAVGKDMKESILGHGRLVHEIR